MKTFSEFIPLKTNSSYIVREFHAPNLTYPLHQHPQYEISLVIQGEGTRIIGDHVDQFSPGDLVLVGPDLPHRWLTHTDLPNSIHNIIIQMGIPFLGKGFLEREEMLTIRQLFDLSARGIQFYGADAKRAAGMVAELAVLHDFAGIMKLLDIIYLLSTTKSYRILSGSGFLMDQSLKGYDSINLVLNHLMENYTREISLDEVAGLVRMNKSAFAHFFKKRTNLNFSVYVNDLRISHSVSLLIQSHLSISEICYQSGFNNLSYFNRVFLLKYGISPKKYREKWRMNRF